MPDLRRAGFPLVTDIHRLSMDDGPGLRTVVFLKGCPLACEWCHNPDNISPEPQLRHHAARCVGAGECVAACPEEALSPGHPPRLDPDRCTLCGRCVDECPVLAWRVIGTPIAPSDLVETVLRDRSFFEASGGGVTFSGGEPTMFPAYLSLVLEQLASAGVHTAIETAGCFAWSTFAAELLPHLDLVLFDLKLFDPGAHARHTGAGNAAIKGNFVRLCEETSVEVVPRVPLVPGITATDANLDAIRGFVRGRRCEPLILLPFNPVQRSRSC